MVTVRGGVKWREEEERCREEAVRVILVMLRLVTRLPTARRHPLAASRVFVFWRSDNFWSVTGRFSLKSDPISQEFQGSTFIGDGPGGSKTISDCFVEFWQVFF